MASIFLELLSMVSSVATQFLRLPRLEWTHSILLRHLKTILWQRPKTLNDVPYDVVFVLSHYLSVRDLCNLRETSKQLSSLVRDRSIWLLALRDILEVRPIPRLSFSLDEMDLDEIMTATLRLTTLDRKTRGADPIAAFTPCRSFDVSGLVPVPLPGGHQFVTLRDSKRELVVHNWNADILGQGRLLVPASKYPIYLWRVVPVSSTTINVAVVSLEQLNERDDRGKPLPRTHVSIYCCDANKGTFEQIDHFFVDTKIWTVFVDTIHLAILWNDWERGQFAYIRLYAKGLHAPVMSLKDPKGSITVISRNYFIVVDDNGTYTRIYKLPDVHPVYDAHVADASVHHSSVWSTVRPGDYFRTPRVASVVMGDPPYQLPRKFVVWTGRKRFLATLSSSLDGADVAYNVDAQPMWPGFPFSGGCDEGSSMGNFSGVHCLTNERLVMLFGLPVTHASSRGLMRLDSTPCSDAIQVTQLICPGLQEAEFISQLAYDEESGRLFMTYNDRNTLQSRIVLAFL
ncbi:hypothetical protein PLEOSDRAFT_1109777 [Pleurotus ostreatus PC15]|uniref:F-box domain-containing protein n=1 Tax=Pleurotus ostreatus (strain PC15) TaxID=1137138 RepID=A0A067NEY4_PLEO1|nr:hypothetical protein PLEOSDRAFT_1109777 [Pleurotus ostreatus PC15]